MKWNIVAIISLIHFLFACSNSSPSREDPQENESNALFELTFEERMAIRAEMTRLTADAKREADNMYNAFESQEFAILNLETKLELELQKHQALMDQYRLTPADVDFIIQEYVTSQGVQLRN
jgi:hypothetical protein